METPTYYSDICAEALEIKQKYNLTDVQTLLYNHICRGDFKLRNEDGQLFYDKKNNGFGYFGNREWVKTQFKPLIKASLVKFTSLHNCRDRKYTSWYFYSPKYDLNDLVNATCYVSTAKLALIKHYFDLKDGFDKKNKKYGNIEFIYEDNERRGYTFKYKGEPSIYAWDNNGKGIKQDLSWMAQYDKDEKFVNKFSYVVPIHYETFQDMVHDIWSFLAHDGCKWINLPNYTNQRRFTI